MPSDPADSLEARSALTDRELAVLLPTLSPSERIEIVIAKYVVGAVSYAYDGERNGRQAAVHIAHYLSRKIRQHVPELKPKS